MAAVLGWRAIRAGATIGALSGIATLGRIATLSGIAALPRRLADVLRASGAAGEARRTVLLMALVTAYVLLVGLINFEFSLPLGFATARISSYEVISVIMVGWILRLFWQGAPCPLPDRGADCRGSTGNDFPLRLRHSDARWVLTRSWRRSRKSGSACPDRVRPVALAGVLAGVTLGILWGAMPGLSTTMAMTLLIGLTVGMSQYTAIMFMLGSIPAAYSAAPFRRAGEHPGHAGRRADDDRRLSAGQARRGRAGARYGDLGILQ